MVSYKSTTSPGAKERLSLVEEKDEEQERVIFLIAKHFFESFVEEWKARVVFDWPSRKQCPASLAVSYLHVDRSHCSCSSRGPWDRLGARSGSSIRVCSQQCGWVASRLCSLELAVVRSAEEQAAGQEIARPE